jgi:hypothetical protein
MKTTYPAVAGICLLAAISPLRADDKTKATPAPKGGDLSTAKGTVDPIRLPDPPKVSTNTRTQEQAAKEYKDSGKPTGPSTLKTKEVPAPPRNLNPTGDKDVQRGIDSYQRPKQDKKDSKSKSD